MRETIYIQTGSLETAKHTKSRAYTRCNGFHKIHLVDIEIVSEDANGRPENEIPARLTAKTNGKKCDCGFHCMPLNQWEQHLKTINEITL